MAEPEAAEAPHRTWEVRADLNLHIADSDFAGHIYLVEGQNYVVGRLQHTGPLVAGLDTARRHHSIL